MDSERVGRGVFVFAVLAFVAVAVPLVWRGAPLADDFNNCVAPTELGLGGFLAESWRQLGAIRPARFLEILVTGPICASLPFGAAIVVSLLSTLAVAWMARGLLRDLDTPAPWADMGGALWLLQPLGSEAGLWPAALHVPVGLLLALAAVRLYRRGRYGWGAVANLGAALSVEQVIFPLPLAAWLFSPDRHRGRATAASVIVALMVISSFLLWPGANPRLRVSLVQRVAGLAANPQFYVGYPAVGLGLHSIPLAVMWALPWSLPLLALGALAGWLSGPYLASVTRATSRRDLWRGLFIVTTIVVLANVVVVLAVPQQGSPRVFAPTWLVLALGGAAGAASFRWRWPRFLGVAGGLFAAGAILSLALSVAVRLRHADFAERAARIVSSRVPEGGRVALCGVRRTIVPYAPRGAFAVHEFIYDWAAERTLVYYTGRHATVLLAGELWGRPCPAIPSVDAVIDFTELLSAAK